MRFNDTDYHAKREGERRAPAAASATNKARLAHLAMAEHHATRAGKTVQSVGR